VVVVKIGDLYTCIRYPIFSLLSIFLGKFIFPETRGLPRGGSGFKPPPPPKFRSFDKAESNSQFRGKYIRNNLITVRVSLIFKLSGTPN
jgi:hypothetical protein